MIDWLTALGESDSPETGIRQIITPGKNVTEGVQRLGSSRLGSARLGSSAEPVSVVSLSADLQPALRARS